MSGLSRWTTTSFTLSTLVSCGLPPSISSTRRCWRSDDRSGRRRCRSIISGDALLSRYLLRSIRCEIVPGARHIQQHFALSRQARAPSHGAELFGVAAVVFDLLHFRCWGYGRLESTTAIAPWSGSPRAADRPVRPGNGADDPAAGPHHSRPAGDGISSGRLMR
jgi:hypothetical protein